jgi:DNA-binding Xre family transcriptional regulator
MRTERCFSANGKERERTIERLEDKNQESTSKLNMSQSRYLTSTLGATKMALTNLEKQISVKLAYEWKSIYRMLVAMEEGNDETVDLAEFDKICQKFNVSLSNEEISKIRNMFCVPTVEEQDGENAAWTLNYKHMS